MVLTDKQHYCDGHSKALEIYVGTRETIIAYTERRELAM